MTGKGDHHCRKQKVSATCGAPRRMHTVLAVNREPFEDLTVMEGKGVFQARRVQENVHKTRI